MIGHRWYIYRTGLWGTSLPMGHPEQAGTIQSMLRYDSSRVVGE